MARLCGKRYPPIVAPVCQKSFEQGTYKHKEKDKTLTIHITLIKLNALARFVSSVSSPIAVFATPTFPFNVPARPRDITKRVKDLDDGVNIPKLRDAREWNIL